MMLSKRPNVTVALNLGILLESERSVLFIAGCFGWVDSKKLACIK
jgi:hypothetical protein